MPMVASHIVGASESPLRSPSLTNLIAGVVSKHVPNGEHSQTIKIVSRWYETRDGRSALASDIKEKVDELVLRGAAQRLLEAQPDPGHDNLFWAIGSVDTEAAAETIQSSWCPKQIDALSGVRNGGTPSTLRKS